MFGGFEAALAFLMLVMPGLLLIGGYYGGLGRPQALSTSALHTLAQAIAWSAVLLAPAAIWLANDLAEWVKDDEVREHLGTLFRWGYATLLLPFLAGIVLGRLAKKWLWLAKLFGSGTGWGTVADGQGDEPRVRVSFTDSRDTVNGLLLIQDSELTPGGSLSLKDVGPSKRTFVVPSDRVRAVEFLAD